MDNALINRCIVCEFMLLCYASYPRDDAFESLLEVSSGVQCLDNLVKQPKSPKLIILGAKQFLKCFLGLLESAIYSVDTGLVYFKGVLL